MKQFAIIGLDVFGLRMLEQFSEIGADVIIIDKNPDTVNKYKELARDSYILDVINEAALNRIVPQDIDAVIIDLGSRIEASIMVCNFLKKMGIRNIIVKAETSEHGEVLSIVGATRVIYPDREAARTLTPLLVSNAMFQYMAVSEHLVLAEVGVTEELAGKTVVDSNIRSKFGLNIVAIRKSGDSDFSFLQDIHHVFSADDVMLVAGSPDSIHAFVKAEIPHDVRPFSGMFKHLFPALQKQKK